MRKLVRPDPHRLLRKVMNNVSSGDLALASRSVTIENLDSFFRAFNRILGQRQRATMAYRPQANGTAERMVQTLTRALKMYVADVNQQDWDEYAERLTFAINTAQDCVRDDTPFYLIHGWNPRSTLEATLPLRSTKVRDRDPRRWRYHIQRHY